MDKKIKKHRNKRTEKQKNRETVGFSVFKFFSFSVRAKRDGFSMVEVVIAVSIAVLFFLAIYEVILFSNKIMANGLRKIEAGYLAQEGIEAARLMRDNGWTDNIATLNNNTDYYLELVGGQWTLTVTPQELINGIFSRRINLYAVNRDGDDNIAAAGTIDTNTRRVLVNVSWEERGKQYSIPVEAYITNFLFN